MRIGVLGGTFDPVHRGHTYIANRVLQLLNLDRVLLMVSPLPPHKKRCNIAGQHHRYAMAALEVLAESHIYASAFELQLQGPSYTVETMALLRKSYPESHFCFIGGSDSLSEIHVWKNHTALLRDNCCIFVQRPGAEMEFGHLPNNFHRNIEKTKLGSFEIQPGQSFLLEIEAPDISSTNVRKSLAEGKNQTSCLVSPLVLDYIQKYRLYEENETFANPCL